MRKTTITCDRCKREVEDQNAIYPITINVQYHFASTLTQLHKTEWCRPCLEVVGIYSKPPISGVTPPEPISFENMLRALIYDIVEESK